MQQKIHKPKPWTNSKLPPPSESVEQIHLFQWAAINSGLHPELKLLYHIPNGGKRSITTAKRLKAEGVKSGVPDIHLPVARGGYHGLYIEMKRQKGGTTTDLQEEWLLSLSNEGYLTAICKGWEEASKVLTSYLSSNVQESKHETLPPNMKLLTSNPEFKNAKHAGCGNCEHEITRLEWQFCPKCGGKLGWTDKAVKVLLSNLEEGH